MAIFKLFSARQKEARGEVADVFTYDKLPDALKVQIVHLLNDAVGYDSANYGQHHYCFKFIQDTICREHALFKLVPYSKNPQEDVLRYFLDLKSTELALDIVEIAFTAVMITKDNWHFKENSRPKIEPDAAVEELNQRFRQHTVGYQYTSAQIVRVDTELIHVEAVKPALLFLQGKELNGANQEFLKAHEHYRHGRYHEALVDALKSFESTLKCICTNKGWGFQPTDTAKKLLDIVFEKGLLPSFMQSEFSALRGLLESGVPVVRNKLGSHGQGVERVSVPAYWARYALNTTASNIVLLVEAAHA